MTRILALAGLLVLCLWISDCSKPKPPAGPLHQYRIEGEILKVTPGDRTATIKHKAIEGWMGAMTMDYPIRTEQDLAKLHPGDRIEGTVYVQDEDYSVGNIKILPH